MTPLEILKAARELIAVPERWTQGALAKAYDGESLWYGDNRATCFCAEGALKRVCLSDGDSYDAYMELSDAAGMPAHHFNDSHTHPEVIALFDRAITAAEAQS